MYLSNHMPGKRLQAPVSLWFVMSTNSGVVNGVIRESLLRPRSFSVISHNFHWHYNWAALVLHALPAYSCATYYAPEVIKFKSEHGTMSTFRKWLTIPRQTGSGTSYLKIKYTGSWRFFSVSAVEFLAIYAPFSSV